MELFWFFAGVLITMFARTLLPKKNTITHEFDDDTTHVVVHDYVNEEVKRTSTYGTDGGYAIKASWVGKHLCYSPSKEYFQADVLTVGDPKTK